MLEQQPDLLRRFREGEREALARVYRFYFDDVYRLGQHGFMRRDGIRSARIESEADRLDFVQDVFVKAFTTEARLAYDGRRPYKPFLLRIARNLRVDRARRASREPSAGRLAVNDFDLDSLHEASASAPASGGLEPTLHFRLLEETASALSGLDAEVRAVARLRFVEELSQLDVASRLGTTRRRVRTLEGRLLRLLKRTLSRLGLSLEKS